MKNVEKVLMTAVRVVSRKFHQNGVRVPVGTVVQMAVKRAENLGRSIVVPAGETVEGVAEESAAKILATAKEEAAKILDAAREEASKTIDAAKAVAAELLK